VRFLPTWDATLLVHARRTQLLPERYRDRIFHTRNPQSTPTFLVDGTVAGTWRHDQGRVRLEPFQPLPGRARRELDEEAERLAAFHA
jgi:winged helix DNA-binding protein